MDDDFLKSELTQRLYESITKDRMDAEKAKGKKQKSNKK